MKINFISCFDYDLIGQDNLYTWELKRFIKWSERKIIANYSSNITDFGNGLTSDTIIDILTKLECFDFEYIPIEKDIIYIESINNLRMYLFYKDNKWHEGIPPLYRIISKRIGYGYINYINNE